MEKAANEEREIYTSTFTVIKLNGWRGLAGLGAMQIIVRLSISFGMMVNGSVHRAYNSYSIKMCALLWWRERRKLVAYCM